MKFTSIISVFLILLPLNVQAQLASDNSEPIIDEQQVIPEEGSFQSELQPPFSDEVATPGEVEEQEEDLLYPQGEETDWGLGSEEIPDDEAYDQ